MSTCRSCGAEIIWATTVHDRKMPVDAKPVPDGLFLLRRDPAPPPQQHWKQETTPLVVSATSGKARPEEPRYTSHFVTCPNRDQHRRPRTITPRVET